nr:ATP synthase F0 subunit 8 [Moina macrocopa]
MPQIWPMNWILLFILFVLAFMVFMSFIYFIPQTPSFENDTSNQTSIYTLNWKW